MGLKCLGAFVLPPVSLSRPSGIWISLAVCPSLHLFYLFGLSLSKIITWAGTYWSSISCMLTLLSVSPRRQKQVKRGEGGQGEGRKEECLQACWAVSCWYVSWELEPQFGWEAALAGAMCLNFELCLSLSPSTCSGCAKVPRVILDSKTLERVSRRNNVKPYISTAWAIPYVRSLFKSPT